MGLSTFKYFLIPLFCYVNADEKQDVEATEVEATEVEATRSRGSKK